MKAGQINFVKAPGAGHIGALMLVIGVLAAGLAAYDDSRRSDALLHLQERHERLATAVERMRDANGAGAAVNPVLSQSTQAMTRLAAPWGTLLDALENSQRSSDGIALLSIEPDSGRARLRIGGEAKDLSALVGYMQSLEGQGGIGDLRLLTQQIKQEDAQHPVVFQVEAKWGNARPADDGVSQGRPVDFDSQPALSGTSSPLDTRAPGVAPGHAADNARQNVEGRLG